MTPNNRAELLDVKRAALHHHRNGNLLEAQELYRRVLKKHAEDADVVQLLGILYAQRGNSNEALEWINRAIALNPLVPDYYCNLATVLTSVNELGAALDSLHVALSLDPTSFNTLNNIGVVHERQGHIAEAIRMYEAALELAPDAAETMCNLGNALAVARRHEEAIVWYQRAISVRPTYIDAHVQLGNLLAELERLQEAIEEYEKAAALDPENPEISYNIASAHAECGRLDLAVVLYRRVLLVKPNHAAAHINLGNALKGIGLLDEAIASYARAEEMSPGSLGAQNSLLAQQYMPGTTWRQVVKRHREWAKCHEEVWASETRDHVNEPVPHRRLRIGYVSGDLRLHPVGSCLLPVLRAHDRALVQAICYCDVSYGDGMTDLLRDQTDEWYWTSHMSDAELASLVQKHKVDILVDLIGHTRGSRLPCFGRKPAPVQVTWLGWPGTTGLKAIDYRLSDPYLDPPGSEEEQCAEKVVRLPYSFWCYLEPSDAPAVRDLPALERGAITFGCFNKFAKVNDALLVQWARILLAVPGSRLLMRVPNGSAADRVLAKLDAEGVKCDRVETISWVSREAYWALYSKVDICLDCSPYNGHTTTMDSCWMGVPVVSQVGELPVGRAGYSILSNIGLGELIGRTRDEYVDIAVRLSGDVKRLAELRASLRARMKASPLMDAEGFTEGLEAAFRSMWEAWCSKRHASGKMA